MSASVFDTAVSRLLYTPIGQIIVSAIFGLALGLMFKRVCKGNCTNYFAPYVDEVKGQTFKLEDTCYEYAPYMVDCKKEDNALEPYDVNIKPVNKIGVQSNINNN
jgi:hypothetical protein